MAKDCRIADSLISEYFNNATLLPEVNKLINIADKEYINGDYTEVMKLLEKRSNTNLRK